MSYYKIDQLEPWLYRFYDPMSVNCFLVIGKEKALLLDAGYGIVSLVPEIQKITDKPLTVVLSHGHVDHANGAFEFAEAWMHEADMDVLKEHTTAEWRGNLAQEAAGNGVEGFDPVAYVAKQCPKINFLTMGQQFELGELTCEVVAMPGHTAGSVGLLIKEGKILLAGDGASHLIWLFMNESTLVKEYVEMLKRTMQLDFDYFFTGHTDWKNPKAEFAKFIQVAEAATFEQAKPYDVVPNESYIYEEGDTAIVFSKRTIEVDSC